MLVELSRHSNMRLRTVADLITATVNDHELWPLKPEAHLDAVAARRPQSAPEPGGLVRATSHPTATTATRRTDTVRTLDRITRHTSAFLMRRPYALCVVTSLFTYLMGDFEPP